MKKRCILIMFNMLMLVAVGCATVSIKSSRDMEFKQKLDRLYVVIDHGELDVSHSETLKEGLSVALSQKQIQSKIYVLSPLDLEENAYEADMASYDPQAILRIEATSSTVGDYGGLAEIVYNVSLVTLTNDKRIWRAQTKNAGGTAMMGKRLRKMANRIVDQLANDGLI